MDDPKLLLKFWRITLIGVYVIVFLKICNKKCNLPNRTSVRSSSNIVYSRYRYRSIGKTLTVVG